MSTQEHFERILEELLKAALDDTHWPAIADLMDEAREFKGNILVTGDGSELSVMADNRYPLCQRQGMRCGRGTRLSA